MRKQPVLIALIIVLIAITLAVMAWLRRDTGPTWQPAAHPYSESCEPGCKELATLSGAHSGEVGYFLNPGVDDAVAQWADCLDSIMKCVDIHDATDTATLPTCVTQSMCPEECKQHFSAAASKASTVEDYFNLFDSEFLNPGAYCRPPAEAE